MAYVLGVALIAFAILLSVSLHEAGHMATAKMFGMKVTRYFVGFGPTLWSFRRGETEYGVKAIPLGGFVKIVGMTPQDDDVEPGDERRAMWRYPVWKRTIVMAAGSVTHFGLALTALYFAAIFVGLPNPEARKPQPAYIEVQPCVVVAAEARACQQSDPTSPASLAGLRTGDKIVSFGGVPIGTYDDLFRRIRTVPAVPTELVYERDGVQHTTVVDLATVQRPQGRRGEGPIISVAAMGVAGILPPGMPLTVTYGPVSAVGASADFSYQMLLGTLNGIKNVPQRVPDLWHSITGGPRQVDTPISVVGASRLGGDAVENEAWEVVLFLFIALNFFVGIFNLLPLLPLDGGHIAVAWFEKARSWVYARLGRPDPGRVDYLKLMPITYVVILIFGGFTLLTVTADIVNPIKLF